MNRLKGTLQYKSYRSSSMAARKLFVCFLFILTCKSISTDTCTPGEDRSECNGDENRAEKSKYAEGMFLCFSNILSFRHDNACCPIVSYHILRLIAALAFCLQLQLMCTKINLFLFWCCMSLFRLVLMCL